jgi:hypothetical protein
MISASPTLAVQIPTAPSATCFFAMIGLLCVLLCGRSALPPSRELRHLGQVPLERVDVEQECGSLDFLELHET